MPAYGRAMGRQGSRAGTSGWGNVSGTAGPIGSGTMTRIMVIRRVSAGAAAQALWFRADVATNSGWRIDLASGVLTARVGNGGVFLTATGVATLPLMRHLTVGFTLDAGGGGLQLYVDGASAGVATAVAAYAVPAAAPHHVGQSAGPPTPTEVARGTEFYGLLSSDTAALTAAQIAVAHTTIVSNLEQGRSLLGIIAGQNRTWDGETSYRTVFQDTGSARWNDLQTGDILAVSTVPPAPQRVFRPVQF